MSNKTVMDLYAEALAEIRQLKQKVRELEEANYNLQMAEAATNDAKAKAIRDLIRESTQEWLPSGNVIKVSDMWDKVTKLSEVNHD